MAAIIEREGRYLVRVRRRGFKSVAKTFASKKDASAYGRKVEADMEAGRWRDEPAEVPTLKDAVKIYRTTIAPSMKGAATYRYRFDEFESLSFAVKPVNKVMSFEVAAWRDKQLTDLKPGTVVRKLAMLSAIFSFCVKERGWLASNPVSSVRRPRVNDARNRVLSGTEVDQLMAAAKSSRATWLAPALTVLLRSAMRRSELHGLCRQDLNLDSFSVRLRETKNGSPRDVPLCPRTVAALRELDLAAGLRGEQRLLPIGVAGSLSTRFKITVQRAQRAYWNNCQTAGVAADPSFLKDVRLHDCRHHAVSAWANTGALSLIELMAISGHKTPRMLSRYAHLNTKTLAQKMASLDVHGSKSDEGFVAF